MKRPATGLGQGCVVYRLASVSFPNHPLLVVLSFETIFSVKLEGGAHHVSPSSSHQSRFLCLLVEFLQISDHATISGNVAVGTGTIVHPTAEILAIVSVLPVLALVDISLYSSTPFVPQHSALGTCWRCSECS
jgi:hypothetical protein